MSKLSSNILLTEDRLSEWVDYALTQEAFVFDVETMGDNRGVCHLNRMSWISLATRGTAVVVPFGHPIGTRVIGTHKEPRLCTDGKIRNYTIKDYEPPPRQLAPDIVFGILEPLFFSNKTKIAHGSVFDFASITKMYESPVPGPRFDTIIGDWLVNENHKKFGLKYRVKEIYGFEYDNEDVGKCIEKYPFATVAYYSYCDAKYPWLMYQDLLPQLEAWGIQDVLDLELSVLEVLIGMRLAGSRVDVPRLKELQTDLRTRKEESTLRLYEINGSKFNPNSPAQLQRLLYTPDGQGLQGWKLTDSAKKRIEANPDYETDHTDYSCDKEALESYGYNKFVAELLNYREIDKLLGTYVESYLGDGAEKSSQIYSDRIYADFVQYGTTTGRFSCRKPNLQNIPRPDSDLGKLIRGAWIAPDAHRLIVADYGQIELVMFAHFCGKGALYDGFWEGIDPHTMTAAAILGKSPDEVLPAERQQYGKTMNFAMAFGAGLYKVAAMLDCSPQRAKSVLKAHRKAMPEVYALKEAIVDSCRKQSFVTTLSGRVRRLPEIYSKKDGTRMYAERQAVSSVIQGSAADLNKWAMSRFDIALKENIPEAFLSLTVHDELVAESPNDKAKAVAVLLEDAMVGAWMQDKIKVPLKADVKIVDRWSEAK